VSEVFAYRKFVGWNDVFNTEEQLEYWDDLGRINITTLILIFTVFELLMPRNFYKKTSFF